MRLPDIGFAMSVDAREHNDLVAQLLEDQHAGKPLKAHSPLAVV